jgi:hypothetical protein
MVWAGLPRTPYRQLWIQWVNIEHLALYRADAPEVVDETMRLLGEQLQTCMRVTRRAMERIAVPCIDFPDNITAPIIGDRLFARHCVRYYDEMAELAREAKSEAIVAVHMDGALKPLRGPTPLASAGRPV